mmetsp:Transcript_8026/g.13868  ORF Transcript_8026/g.13868 Transcript_8026/m.13868 type:complete len:200 (+) Transcript_8026:71-670(+)
MPADYDHLVKVLLIGDSSVGKSCLLLRFVDDTYTESYISTIGADYKIKDLSIDNARVRLQVWDTAGQERFRTITSSFYRGSHGIMVVYDVCNKESFTNVSSWLQEVNRYAAENVTLVIVGNKSDDSAARQVSLEEGKQLASEQGIEFIETSAKLGSNVNEAFLNMAKVIKDRLAGKRTTLAGGLNVGKPQKQKKKCMLL